MAIQTQDFTAMLKDAMGAFPVDTKSFEDSFRTQATLAEKLTGVAVEAAGRSTELSAAWSKDILGRYADVTKAKAEPADYAKAWSDFMTYGAESGAEHMAAYAEIAKKAQMETVELLMAAGKTYGDEFNAAATKAGETATATAKKATAAAK